MTRLLPLLLLAGCLPNSDCPRPDTDPDTDTTVEPPDDADEDGFTEEEGDCDDTDPEVYPGAVEMCSDGVDQDCDGSDTKCLLFEPRSLADAEGSTTDVWPPRLAFDVTDDGNDDLIVGVRNGRAEVWTYDEGLVRAMSIVDSESTAGERVSGPGDVTGDGVADLLVGRRQIYRGGAPGPDDVFLIPGPVSGDVFLPNGAFTLTGTPLHSVGEALGGPVDYNGDGVGDVLIGAPHFSQAHPGEAVLLLGPITDDVDLATADYRFVGESNGDVAGRVVDGAGDVDGDGSDDILVGTSAPEGKQGNHFVYLVLSGREPGTHDLADAEGVWNAGRGEFFAPLALAGAGDTDGDGYDDVLIGSFRANDYKGAAWLLRGSATPDLSVAHASFSSEKGAQLGYAVSTVRDVNLDGNPDFLVSAPQLPEGGDLTGAGITYVVDGVVQGSHVVELSADDPDLVAITGPERSMLTGRAVGSAGDLNGDGYSDAFIGADNPKGLWVLLGGFEP